MNRKMISVFVVLVVLASSITAITACTTKDSYLIQIMKIAPEDTTHFSCVDTGAMADDPDFSSLYEDVTIDYLVYGLELQDAGIDISEIYALSYLSGWDWSDVLVLVGDFNLKDVRDALMVEEFIKDEYQGIEVWIHDLDDAVAFIGDMIISSEYTDAVEACIRIHQKMESSLYDNDDMKSVIEKLPIAPLYMLQKTVDIDEYEPGALCYGICISNKHRDDETLDISAWFKFDSEANAEYHIEDMEDFMGYWFEATNIESELSGQFIEMTGEMSSDW